MPGPIAATHPARPDAAAVPGLCVPNERHHLWGGAQLRLRLDRLHLGHLQSAGRPMRVQAECGWQTVGKQQSRLLAQNNATNSLMFSAVTAAPSALSGSGPPAARLVTAIRWAPSRTPATSSRANASAGNGASPADSATSANPDFGASTARIKFN
jgi:hypothetical protein